MSYLQVDPERITIQVAFLVRHSAATCIHRSHNSLSSQAHVEQAKLDRFAESWESMRAATVSEPVTT